MENNKFEKALYNVFKQATERSLEEYLLALYQLLPNSPSAPCSHEILLQLLEHAFTAPFTPYANQWDKVKVPVDDDEMVWLKFTHPDVKNHVSKPQLDSSLDYTKQVIQFQVKELHSMRGKQLDNEYRFFGISSDSGHTWYNFTPVDNLSCGFAGLSDNLEDEETSFNISWGFLGLWLEMGRIYE
ncbi:hypothetical protein VQ643_06635 [Pseudomonas sp. F1_0610]|uniref:hypothetical protein n=1 Tax=Pseudomonas sp. F1_0610 TaxID=3114284 RepID=UPI0039C26832